MSPEDIQASYDAFGLTQGWRFLTSPQRTLESARVAIVTLNPGGERDLERGLAERWSCEAGSAYRVESWGDQAVGADPLQRQIQRLCQMLGEAPDDVLSGHFVPFRSRDWASLPRCDEAALFGLELWRWVLARAPARLIVCIGKTVAGDGIAAAAGDALQLAPVPTGWGSTTIDRYLTADGRRIVALPHLSRFRLFGDPARERAFHEALAFGNASAPAATAMAPTVPSLPKAAAPAASTGGRGGPIRRGAQRPGDGTAWALVVERVPLSGITEAELLSALALVPRHDLPARALATPSRQVPGSRVWWRGYIAGCLKRGFLTT